MQKGKNIKAGGYFYAKATTINDPGQLITKNAGHFTITAETGRRRASAPLRLSGKNQ